MGPQAKITVEGRPQPRSEWSGAEVPSTNDRTDAEIAPESWDIETISAIADVKTGPFGSTLHERDYADSGTPIVTVEHLSERGILHHNLPLVSDSDRVRLKRYSLRAGDIVFSRVGSVDRNALVREAEDGWLFSVVCFGSECSEIDSPCLPELLSSFGEFQATNSRGCRRPNNGLAQHADLEGLHVVFPSVARTARGR